MFTAPQKRFSAIVGPIQIVSHGCNLTIQARVDERRKEYTY